MPCMSAGTGPRPGDQRGVEVELQSGRGLGPLDLEMSRRCHDHDPPRTLRQRHPERLPGRTSSCPHRASPPRGSRVSRTPRSAPAPRAATGAIERCGTWTSADLGMLGGCPECRTAARSRPRQVTIVGVMNPGPEAAAAQVTRSRPSIVPWDPAWPVRGAQLAAEVAASIGPTATRVEHIGSTSIPGMAAKPVFDLQVSVLDLAQAAPVVDAAVASLGLTRMPWERDASSRRAPTTRPNGGSSAAGAATCRPGSGQPARATRRITQRAVGAAVP